MRGISRTAQRVTQLAFSFFPIACTSSFGTASAADTVAVEARPADPEDVPLEALINAGADFHVAGAEKAGGVGGFRLEMFEWANKSRVGLEVGVLNTAFCDERSCASGRGEYVLPLGVEADTFFFADRLDDARALLGAGARFIAYSPPPGTTTRSSSELSAQVALRLLASFGRSRFSRFHTSAPAGLTLDHGFYAGPSILSETGGTALLVGYSVGIGLCD